MGEVFHLGYEAGRVDSLSDYTRNDLHSNEFGLRTTLNWRKVRLNIRFGLSPQKSTTKSNRGKSEDRYDHYRVEHSARTAF